MLFYKDKLFCEINPTCYKISKGKEILKRNVRNTIDYRKFTNTKSNEKLPNLVSSHHSNMIKTGPGIDPVLQENKAININISSNQIYGTIIKPNQIFSFWHTVGKITEKKGYKQGRILKNNKLIAGIGGGLCNLANTLHLLILHSPLDVIEFHSHSDALAPDKEGKRIPFSAGTSITYNNLDYRFKNNTDQNFQLLMWCKDNTLYGELRSEKEIPYTYDISEENHHFRKEKEKFYRVSKIYKNTYDKETHKLLKKELVLDNHSEVMFDYDLIPKEQIR